MRAQPAHVVDSATRACNNPPSCKGETGKPGWALVSATVPGDLPEKPGSSSWEAKTSPRSFLALREETCRSPFLATPPHSWRVKKQRWNSGMNNTGQKQEGQPWSFPVASSTLSLIYQQPPRPHPKIPLRLLASVQARGL